MFLHIKKNLYYLILQTKHPHIWSIIISYMEHMEWKVGKEIYKDHGPSKLELWFLYIPFPFYLKSFLAPNSISLFPLLYQFLSIKFFTTAKQVYCCKNFYYVTLTKHSFVNALWQQETFDLGATSNLQVVRNFKS